MQESGIEGRTSSDTYAVRVTPFLGAADGCQAANAGSGNPSRSFRVWSSGRHDPSAIGIAASHPFREVADRGLRDP